MSRELTWPALLGNVPHGWHVVTAWVVGTFETARGSIEGPASDFVRDQQALHEVPLRLVVTQSRVRAFSQRLNVLVVGIIAPDDAPPVDFPEPAS